MILCTLALFTACTEDEGTDPGHDSSPVVTLYQYTAGDGYNSDNDCFVRIVTNSAVKEVYYLAQLQSAKTALNLTDDKYADYVVENGTKLDLTAASDSDLYITDLHGLYDITVVAVNGNSKDMKTVEFAGLDYKDYGTGVWTSAFFGSSWRVNVEYSEVGNRYRINDLYVDGYGFSFSPDGSNVTVYPNGYIETGYVHPNYGMIYFSDQGSTYDENTKTFVFNFKFIVSAGSFGTLSEVLVLDN